MALNWQLVQGATLPLPYNSWWRPQLSPLDPELRRKQVDNGWMEGWMNGWVEGWMDGSKEGRKDGQTNGCMDVWTCHLLSTRQLSVFHVTHFLRLYSIVSSRNSLEAPQRPDYPFSTGPDVKSCRVALCVLQFFFFHIFFPSFFIVLSAAELHWNNQSEDSDFAACVELADHWGDLDT